MLFFFGTGSSPAGQYPLPGVACVNCGHTGSLVAVVSTRYFQFFWIPVFPFSKRCVTVCTFCQQALSQGQWPAAYQQPAFAAKNQARTPLTNYIGLMILAVPVLFILAGGVVALFRSTTGTAAPAATSTIGQSFNAPRAGDFYATATSNGHRYSVLQVLRTGPDTVVLQASTYQPHSLDALSQHPDSAHLGITGNPLPMTRASIELMHQSGQVTLVRP